MYLGEPTIVNEIKLEWIKGRAVVRMQCYSARWWVSASGGTVGEGKIIGGKGDWCRNPTRECVYLDPPRSRYMFAAEKHFINVIRPQPSPSPFCSVHPSLSPQFSFAFCFHFFSHLLVISLSLFPSVFRFPSFSPRVFTPCPPPLSFFSSPLYSLPLWTFSLCDFVFLPLISFCFHNDVRSANISSPLLGGFGIGADVFRLNERR